MPAAGETRSSSESSDQHQISETSRNQCTTSDCRSDHRPTATNSIKYDHLQPLTDMAIREAFHRYVLQSKSRLASIINPQHSPPALGDQPQIDSTASGQQPIETTQSQQESDSTAIERQQIERTDRSSTTSEDRQCDARAFEEINDALKRLETNQITITESLNKIKAERDAEMSALNGMLLLLESIVEHLQSAGTAQSGRIERCYFHDQFGRVSYTCRPPCSLYDPAAYSIAKADGTFGKQRRADHPQSSHTS